ncbi:hypothetical protein RHGRI_013700 [Rhododendron griersonianum]|uniref:Agglutinin domain-containing protein n=1 Tax=Rhododendron griersonianum TaxID=479676 RepID=A0AAV6K6I6_9ERIC|nr:hypothetical protein RHGRI_013700 [Rhododendron griersonianum]
MAKLPQYVVIKSLSNKKYLRPGTGANKFLRFGSVNVNSRGVKHEVVYSKSHPGKIHIKCVHTGRYWAYPLNTDAAARHNITAEVKKPNANINGSDVCTLFTYRHNIREGVFVYFLYFADAGDWETIGQRCRAPKPKVAHPLGTRVPEVVHPTTTTLRITTLTTITTMAKVRRIPEVVYQLAGKGSTGGGASDGDDVDDDDYGENTKNTGGGPSTGNTSTGGGASTGNTFSGGGPAIGSTHIHLRT